MAHERIGPGAATLLVLGAMIGSGIMVLPGLMVAQLPSPVLVLVALAVGGLLSAMGALVMAELATLFPRAGGQFHYLREGLGPLWGFLFGWGMFALVLTGLLAAIAAAFAGFVSALVPLPGHSVPLVVGSWNTGLTLPPWGNAFVAVALIWFLVALNLQGSRVGNAISNVTGVAKYGGLALLVLILVAGRHTGHPLAGLGPSPFDGASVPGFVAALAFGLFAFDGWVVVTYMAAQVRDPARTLPRALIAGPALVALLYLALTAAFFWALSTPDAVAVGSKQGLIAVEAARAAGGGTAALFVAVVGVVSLFGTANVFVLAVPRIFQAMAQEGALPARLAAVSKAHVPAKPMVALALWSSILAMTGLYGSITYMVVFGQWFFYLLTAVAFLRLRKSHPTGRTFRTPLYPVVPLLFLVASAFIVVLMLARDVLRPYAILAAIVIALGVPLHFMRPRRQPSVEP
ncbi:MAG: APC family permease [Thermoplasmatota archaeon]